MAQMTVRVNNQNYVLAVRDGDEDRLRALAAHMDENVRNVAQRVGNVGEAHLLLMAGLVVADELFEARDGDPGAAGRPGLDEKRLDQLAGRIESIAADLEKA